MNHQYVTTKEERLSRSRGQGRKLALDCVGPKLDGPHVVSFSGGRTSGMMLRKLLDRGLDLIVLYANTGKERDETLDFVHEVETRWKVPVVWLEYCRVKTNEKNLKMLRSDRMRALAVKNEKMHWFKVVNYETAARHQTPNGPFDKLLEWTSCLPNPRARICTGQLKVRTMQRWLWSQGIYSFINHIGFRYDELDRVADLVFGRERDQHVGFRFILAELGINLEDVTNFWNRQKFDLKLQPYEGNCHLCFLKKKAVKERLIREQPELVAWYAEWEEKKSAAGNGGRWNIDKGMAITELMESAKKSENCDTKAFMDCSCTAGVTLGSKLEDEGLDD